MKKSTVILGLLLLTGCTVIPKPDSSTAIYNFAVYTPSAIEQPEQHIVKNGKKYLSRRSQRLHGWIRRPYITVSPTIMLRNPILTPTADGLPPAFLLTQQIKQKIAADTHHLVIKDSSVAIVEYELHIEIEEFSQIFSTLSDSYVSIRFRASLVNHAHRLIAQKIFSTSHAAATADAAGAVDGFTIASNRLMNELVEWLNSAVDNF